MSLYTYSTEDVSEKDKVPYWNDALCKTFTRKFVDPHSASGFSAKFDVASIGEHNIANVVQSASDVVHTLHHSKTDDPAVTLHLQVFGESINMQEGAVAKLRPGEFTFCSSERPYKFITNENMGLFVHKIPRDKFCTAIDDPLEIACMKFSGVSGPGKMFVQFMQNYWRELVLGMPEDQAMEMIDVAVGMLGSVINAERTADQTISVFDNKLDHIRRFIEINISRPDLSPRVIAEAFGMSVRNLHKLFASSHYTVGNYVRSRRLEHARWLLSDPEHTDRSLTEIALICGFSNPAQFSTAFKNEYGRTPSLYRARK